MKKIKVAIAGIGNCASSLIQGIEYYREVDKKSGFVPGILNNVLGNYCIRDIEFVACFDVDKNKVGKDLSKAIFSTPNCASIFCEIPYSGIKVLRGPVLDGLNGYLKQIIPVDRHQPEVNVSDILIESSADILINYLPTGSKKATEYYAQQALNAQCGFINGIPEPIASSKIWRDKYYQADLPLVGDDIKSQLGATPLHRSLIDLFSRGGCKITNSRQENIGSNTDFYNLSNPERVKSKINCKVTALQNLIPYATNISVDIKYEDKSCNDNCSDAKKVRIHIDGENFGSRPIILDVELYVEDSPNGAGAMVDVIRTMKIALDRGDSGVIDPICGKYFKHPPVPCDDLTAIQELKKYLSDRRDTLGA